MRKLVFQALVVTTLGMLASAAARSEDDPKNSLRIGSYTAFYHTSADDLQGPYVPSGVNFNARNLETLYLGYVRSVTDHWLVDVALGWPPLSKMEGKGLATVGSVPYNGQVVASSRWLAPAVLLDYQFFGPDARLRPYIGVGVSYVQFYDRSFTTVGNEAAGGPTRLSMTSSVGPAGTLGVSYRITGNFFFHASISGSSVKTKITADTAGIIRTTHIQFAPTPLILAVGYAF